MADWCGNFEDAPWEKFHGLVDIVTAGFPCQPWSAAGKREGTKDERWLWPAIARCLSIVKPPKEIGMKSVQMPQNMTEPDRVDFKQVIADLELAGITIYKLSLMLHRRFNTVNNWKKTGRLEYHDGRRLEMIHDHYCKELTTTNPQT